MFGQQSSQVGKSFSGLQSNFASLRLKVVSFFFCDMKRKEKQQA